MKKRIPDIHEENPRDKDGNRHGVTKNLWRKTAKKQGVSLKVFATQRASLTEEGAASPEQALSRESAARWLKNKRAHTQHPPLGIGRTNGKTKKAKPADEKKDKKKARKSKPAKGSD